MYRGLHSHGDICFGLLRGTFLRLSFPTEENPGHYLLIWIRDKEVTESLMKVSTQVEYTIIAFGDGDG